MTDRNHLDHLTDEERKEIATRFVVSSPIDRELEELIEQSRYNVSDVADWRWNERNA